MGKVIGVAVWLLRGRRGLCWTGCLLVTCSRVVRSRGIRCQTLLDCPRLACSFLLPCRPSRYASHNSYVLQILTFSCEESRSRTSLLSRRKQLRHEQRRK